MRLKIPRGRTEGGVGGLATLVAAVGLATFAVMVAIAWIVSERGDRAEHEQDVGRLRSMVAEMRASMETDMVANAFRAVTFDKAHANFDAEWVARNIGSRLHSERGHDTTVLLAPDKQLRLVFDHGQPVEASYGLPMLQSVLPQIDAVRAKSGEQSWSLRRPGSMARIGSEEPRKPVVETVWAEVGGRSPALISIAAVMSEDDAAQVPTLLVSMRRLEGNLLAEIGSKLGLADLRVMRVSGNSGDDVVALANPDGTSLGALAWTGSNTSTGAFFRVVPVIMAVLLGAFAAMAALVKMIGGRVARIKAEVEQSRAAVEVDHLTGFPNRRRFVEMVDQAVARLKGDDRDHIGLLHLDLDRFKEINDVIGHAGGDEVLKLVAQRLTSILRPSDAVAHISGDEFLIMLDRRASKTDIESMCEAIVSTLGKPMTVQENELTVGATIGIAIAPVDGNEHGELMRKADIARYRAKAEARGGWRFFVPEMDEVLKMRKMIRAELANAIKRDELQLLYQPQVSSDGKRLVGVEGLIRWKHPTRGMVSPGYFIPVAEETGLISDLGRWVVQRACLDGRRWPGISVAVNASPAQFKQGDFVADVCRIVAETQMDPTRLEIEITEGVLMSNTDMANRILNGLRDAGMRLALDDFGTGYSSLSYLRSFPFGKLKIDRSFFLQVDTDSQAGAVVQAIIAIADALDMKVTAEGIETAGQHRFAQAVGCHSIQGFYFSKPVPAEEIDRWLAEGVPQKLAA
ncbi:MAG: bifunctional diguanylate cyclase/phosphodiesterase [Hyphomicrobiaceae bacterium]|nr:bifunctional diguanylate cyclase/phosphodiesterase [Hyphomicrobiaceae bacterium]